MLGQFSLILLIIFFSRISSASEGQLKKILSEVADAKTNFSMFAAADYEKIIAKQNENTQFVPASVTKIITGVVVLQELGPASRLKTILKANKSEIAKDKLNGDLCLVGAGDPSFVSENMWIIVNNFSRTGVKQISGDIIVNDRLFDQILYDETRLKNRVDRAYDAPVGAMSFNWNSVNVHIRPAQLGEKATVILDPLSQYLQLDAEVTTSRKTTDITVSKNSKRKIDKIVVRGTINEKSDEKVHFIPISQPALWSGYNLKSFLEQRSITLRGEVRQGSCPENFEEVASSESKPIEQMVKDMNKFSNNYVAEMLIKLLGAKEKKQNASLADGMKFIQGYLARNGFLESEIKITNPSGLTRENLVTAKALWRLLKEAHGDLAINGELVASLPLAGIDGTLRNRLQNEATRGRVRAKTGYINGIVSLAGYYSNRQGQIVPFAFLYNGSENEAKVRGTMDKLILYLVRQ